MEEYEVDKNSEGGRGLFQIIFGNSPEEYERNYENYRSTERASSVAHIRTRYPQNSNRGFTTTLPFFVHTEAENINNSSF
jgi:hypothetical protein